MAAPPRLHTRLGERIVKRFGNGGTGGMPRQETLRLPIELILYVCDLASESCPTEFLRDRLHDSFAGVNRYLRSVYRRRTYRFLTMSDGTFTEGLVHVLKNDKALAEGLEGLVVPNLSFYYSLARLMQHVPKLRKVSKGFVHLDIGSREYRPDAPMHTGLDSWWVGDLVGLEALHLHYLKLQRVDKAAVYRLKPKHVPALPSSLKHLTLDHVYLYSAFSPDHFWPPARDQSFALETLFARNVTEVAVSLKPPFAGSTLEALLVRTSRSLRALHFTHPRDLLSSETDLLASCDLAFPALELLCTSVAWLSPALLARSGTSLRYVALTLDLGEFVAPSTRDKYVSGAAAALVGALERDELPRLEVLELPMWREWDEAEGEAFWAEVKAKARQRGAVVKLVQLDEDQEMYQPVKQFQRMVREVLRVCV
ncbi:uncharacterized protein JCM10292_005222 [Rhodotorula paludigena]|uniref:uncharacterized protein n=1 Tax=Rhodotorula paludigena TaxID=86838 RepID=UPI00316E0C4E